MSSPSRSTDTVELERRINARRETVFAYFTDPERFARWQGVEAEIDPDRVARFASARPPILTTRRRVSTSRFDLRVAWCSPGAGNRHRIWPRGSEHLPPGASTVEVDLIPDGDGTVLRLRHSGLPGEAACRFHTTGWESTLELIRADLVR